MRLSLFLLISLAIVSDGQDAGGSVSPIQATLKPGATAGRLVVPIVQAPASGDRLGIETDTNALKITVVTPDGRRITSANADANGFDWSESPGSPRIGSTDGGYHAVLFFTAAGTKGNYTIEFASGPLSRQAAVSAWFISERDEYDQMFKQLPGAQRAGPVSFDSSKRTQDLTLSLAADESGTMIDIVVTNPNTAVSLKLPSGATLTPQTPKRNDFEWRTASSRDKVDPPDTMFGIRGFVLPREGTHHVIGFRAAAKGDYKIHLELSGSSAGEAEAMILPLERILRDSSASLAQPKLPAGTVFLEATALPYDCFVGDKLDLSVRLVGDTVAGPVRFQVKVETRAPLPNKGGPQEYAPPKVVVTPVSFIRGLDGQYRGMLVPKERGIMRVSIQASGTTAAGKMFQDETLLTNVTVAPLVATFVALTERAVDENRNGRPDRWEVTATLDVLTPGKYEMRFGITGSGTVGFLGDGSATLGAGRQKLTASIPAAKMFDLLKDGPYTVNGVQLYRPEGNSFGNFVKGTVPLLKTAAYKRDLWDRGQVFGEEKVELRPIRPGKGGKYTAVEVTWRAMTQGGHCGWSASLSAGSKSQSFLESGEFLKGSYALTFEFDAAGLAKAPKGEGHFQGIVNCDNGDQEPASASVPLTFDPAQFEAGDSSSHIFSEWLIRAVIGKRGGVAELAVERKPPGAVVYRLTSAPAGLKAVLYGSQLDVSASKDIAPGRYHVDVEATEGNKKETITVMVDAVPDLPPAPAPKYSSDSPRARGLRPNKTGKFQNLEVLWPIILPGGNCSWSGSIRPDNAQLAGMSTFGRLPVGKSILSLVFDGSVIATSTNPNWTFRGNVNCDVRGDTGASVETKLTLQPSTFAKRAGLLVTSDILVRIFRGSFPGITTLSVKTDDANPPVFEVVNPPAGFHTKMKPLRGPAAAKGKLVEVSADESVMPGRYYLPVKVTVGTNQGTGDIIVDVVPE